MAWIGVAVLAVLALGSSAILAEEASASPDTTGPTPIISSSSPSITNEETIQIIVNFGETLAAGTFNASDVTLSQAVPSTLHSLDSPRTFNASETTASSANITNFRVISTLLIDTGDLIFAQILPIESFFVFDIVNMTDGVLIVDIAAGVANDTSDNLNNAADQFSIIVDRVGPDPVFTTTANASSSSVPVTLDFGETLAAGTFTKSDITAHNATVGDILASGHSVTYQLVDNTLGITYQWTEYHWQVFNMNVTNTLTNERLLLSLPAGAATDEAGNPNQAAELRLTN
ncbi:MAG: hypothetical protein OXP12_03825 [Thaumarchaeota archaeon]|nr:hypothetical protein [Nitrososphaerota archaeon]